MSNPIESNWGGRQNRPSRGSGRDSPRFDSVKNAGSKVADVAGNAGRSLKDTCCSPEVKEELSKLITYTATIIIALAWWEMLSVGIFYRIIGPELWWMWVVSVIVIILAMVVCWFTGESLAFGEDCC